MRSGTFHEVQTEMKTEEDRKEVSIREACEITRRSIVPLEETEIIPMEDSCGRVTAEDISADFDQPPFDKSPLDGFAVRAEDVAEASPESPAELVLAGEVWAGNPPSVCVEEGQAVRIMTGAPMPAGSDCVVKQEDAELVPEDMLQSERISSDGKDAKKRVRIFRSVKKHQNYCFSGEDFQKGQRVIPAGRKLEFTDTGLLASLGMTEVKVFRRPRAAVIATGDEIVLPGQSLAPGKIYNSNMYMIRAGILNCGGEVPYCAQAEDSPESIGEHLLKAVEKADLVITTGGVSVGKRDYLPEVLRQLEAEILFQKILIKPGAPTTFSMLQGKPVLSLSGSPFGAAVNFSILARPMIGAAGRDPSLGLRYEAAFFEGTFNKASPKTRYVRGILFADGRVRLKDEKKKGGGFHTLAESSGEKTADGVETFPSGRAVSGERSCYIEIPAGTESLRGGELLRVICI